MIAADWSVWARAYLNDDLAQSSSARAAIKAACETDGVFVPQFILAELAWVLRGRWDRDRVRQTPEEIFTTDGVIVESRAPAEKALAASRTSIAGFSDLLIAEASFPPEQARSSLLTKFLYGNRAFAVCVDVDSSVIPGPFHPGIPGSIRSGISGQSFWSPQSSRRFHNSSVRIIDKSWMNWSDTMAFFFSETLSTPECCAVMGERGYYASKPYRN